MRKPLAQNLNSGQIFKIKVTKDLEENLEMINPQLPISLLTQFFQADRRDSVPLHWHNHLQLYWVKEGSLDFQVNSHHFTLNSKSLLFLNRQQVHQSRVGNQDTQAICILFDLGFLNPFLRQEIVNPFFEDEDFAFKLLPIRADHQQLLAKLYDQVWDKLPYLSIVNLLSETVDLVIRNFDTDPEYNRQDQDIFNQLLSYIQSHYNEKITITSLQKHVGINKNYLNQLFHTYSQDSPIGFINRYRLQQAQNLVTNTDVNISEIANMVGFNHLSYFIEQFRKEYGYTPLQYRKQFQQK